MNISKKRISKIRKGARKKPDRSKQIVFVFMTSFFIGVFICLIKFNLEKNNVDGAHSNSSNEGTNNSDLINVTEKEGEGCAQNLEKQRNEEDRTLNSVDGITDEVDIQETIKLQEFSKIYSSALFIDRIKSPPFTANIVIDQLLEQAPDLRPHFNKFRKHIDILHGMDGGLCFMDVPDTALPERACRLFYIFSIIDELLKNNSVKESLEIKDFEDESTLLGAYLNYSILYSILYETSQALAMKIFKDAVYTKQVNKIFDHEEPRIFALKIKNILTETSKKLYKEITINIGMFKDETRTMNGTEILSIYDITKVRNFIRFSMFNALFYIFGLDTENKVSMQPLVRKLFQENLECAEDKENKGEGDIVKVENACQNLYKLFYNKGQNFRESWGKEFDNCLMNLKDFVEKTSVVLYS